MKTTTPFLPTKIAKSRTCGFTLLELLATITIVAVITGLAIGALASMRGTPARHGASRTLLSQIESTRALAIETGIRTRIAFANGHDTSGLGEHQSYYGIFRGATQIGNWKALPSALVFTQGAGTETLMDQPTTFQFNLVGTGTPQALPCLTFNKLGQVISPSPSTSASSGFGGALWIGISHGLAENLNAAPLYTEKNNAGEPTSDFIAVSRYTGRARLVQ